MTLSDDDRAMMAEIFANPVRFSEVALGHSLWRTQREILLSVRDNPRTAVKACHASSKTFTAADACLWWLARSKHGVVVSTAPTALQVEKQLWAYIRRAVARLHVPTWKVNLTEIRIAPDNYAIGISTDEAERFAGWHGEILIIVDESAGVRAQIFNAIEGVRAGGNVRLLLLGNPTIAGGPYYEAFQSEAFGWRTFTIDAFNTPNLQGLTLESLLALPEHELDNNAWPELVTRRWVAERYYEWGVDSPQWQSRVRGEFPTQSQWSVYPLAYLQYAEQAQGDTENGRIIAGLDIAGGGRDETALCLFNLDTSTIVGMWGWTDSDPRGAVSDVLTRYRSRLVAINADESGIGHYFIEYLRDHDYPVIPINVGMQPDDPQRFALLKDEMYWNLRERLETHDILGLVDRITIGQATAITYSIDARARTRVDSKEQLRKRGIPSPDRLEALIFATMPVSPLFRPQEHKPTRGFIFQGTQRKFAIGR